MKKKTVLFVDDDSCILTVSKLFIESLGHKPMLASSTKKAIEIIKKSSSDIDIIFLDICLPDGSNYELIRFLEDLEIQIPIILQTGLTGDKYVDDALTLGSVKAVIYKPYGKGDIENMIKKYAKNKVNT